MAYRTSPERVRSVFPANPSIDVAGHIRTANVLTNVLVTRDTSGVLTAELLEEIETYLAAHFAACRDPQYRSQGVGRSSATYQGQDGKRLESTTWGQQALLLDISGELEKLQQGNNKAEIIWLGQAHSENSDWWDRD